jgi:hypothetical protein
MKTIEPETTLNIEATSVMTKGVRRGLVARVAEDNF